MDGHAPLAVVASPGNFPRASLAASFFTSARPRSHGHRHAIARFHSQPRRSRGFDNDFRRAEVSCRFQQPLPSPGIVPRQIPYMPLFHCDDDMLARQPLALPRKPASDAAAHSHAEFISALPQPIIPRLFARTSQSNMAFLLTVLYSR